MAQERAEIAVVGGGIAGVSIAYELAATRDVVLVEAETELPGTPPRGPRRSTCRATAPARSGR